jgi:SAM-dependent methyltransferase
MRQEFAAWAEAAMQGVPIEGPTLEIGSRIVEGSIRPLIERMVKGRYVGMDVEEGPGVNWAFDATILEDLDLSSCYLLAPDPGEIKLAFGFVVCIDTLEHIEDWRAAIRGIWHVTKPGGHVLLCAAPVGFPHHDHPGDYWRFTLSDFRAMFPGWHIIAESEALPAILLRKPNVGDIRLQRAPSA